MQKNENLLLVVAGEASADAHAAALVKELAGLRPGLEVMGLGGKKLGETGADLVLDFSRVGVVGISELLPAIPDFVRAYRSLMERVKARPPRGALLLDLPDFNLFLAGRIKKHAPAVKIIYYISPQVWAWRRGRVKKIAARADAMLTLFPFEEEIYREAGMDAEFVGHPLKDRVRTTASREELRRGFGLGDETLIALLPGSRSGELKRCLPVMVEFAARLDRERPGLKFILAQAPTLTTEQLEDELGPARRLIRIVADRTYDVLGAADLAVAASGTATLEAALLGTPLVVLGMVAPLSYAVGVRMVNVKRFSLPNLILGMDVVPELIQREANPERLLAEVRALLDHPRALAAMRRDLARVAELLGPGGASQKAAREVAKRLWGDDATKAERPL